jgi:hypothetical protein
MVMLKIVSTSSLLNLIYFSACSDPLKSLENQLLARVWFYLNRGRDAPFSQLTMEFVDAETKILSNRETKRIV